MRIVFQKGIDGRDRVTCFRQDGSCCESELSAGCAYHDLAHFVVESELGLSEGIWGKIVEGFTFAEFNLPNETRPFQISPQGYQAEFLATLIQSAVPTGTIAESYVYMLRDASTAQNLPFPELPPESVLQALIAKAQMLSRQWEALTAGQNMELTF